MWPLESLWRELYRELNNFVYLQWVENSKVLKSHTHYNEEHFSFLYLLQCSGGVFLVPYPFCRQLLL